MKIEELITAMLLEALPLIQRSHFTAQQTELQY